MHLQSQESIEDNLRFLVKEVLRQLHRSRAYLASPSRALRRSLVNRDDYIDNLRTFIQRGCFLRAAEQGDIEYLKSVDIIAVNLERIADFCENLIDQFDHLPQGTTLPPKHFDAFFDCVEAGLDKVESAVMRRDVRAALTIAEAEPRLDELYAKQFASCLTALGTGASPQTEVTLLFIYHYFERMGDALLNVGEAIVSAALGEKIKIGQLWALQSSLRHAGSERSLDDLQLSPLGESRSGAHIARVAPRRPDRDDSNAQATDNDYVIFKEGKSSKVLEEREAIALWESLVPGVAPKAFSYHDGGPNSAILLEYLPGQTFEDIVLRGPSEHAVSVLSRVAGTIESVWQRTRTADVVPSRFVDQLSTRLPDVLSVHPTFALRETGIGGIQVPSLHTLVDHARTVESMLHAPFSVLTHGDFNLDNVIVTRDNRIRLIDLHRSKRGDYVQDVSVFIVSNLRLQIFETVVRKTINDVTLAFYDFSADFAQRSNDTTFSARLGLGLARSFITSTRFLLDEGFAKALFLRARYLLERLVQANTPDEIASFQVPKEVLLD